MANLHDVVIVGAGPAGSTAAVFLARAGLSVVLLDKQRFPRDKPCGDLIAPSVIRTLDELGVGEDLRAASYRIEGVSLTSPGGASVRVETPVHPVFPNYAYVIKRYHLDELIRNAAVQAGARFEGGVRAQGIREEIDGTLTVAGSRLTGSFEVRARVLVVAVGASLPLIKAAGLAPREVRYSFAARAYYEGLADLGHDIQVRFDGVTLPGGGWIFPVSPDAANVGAGYFERSRRTPATASAALQAFIGHERLQSTFTHARQTDSVKGFPLRTDFHRSPVMKDRILLIGEAAGLVNPLTGEGISYAVASARMAAQVVQGCFDRGDLSTTGLSRYERLLRGRYQRMFTHTNRLRRLYLNRPLLESMVRASNRWPEIAELAMGVLLSYQAPGSLLRMGVLAKAVRSLRPARSG